MRKEGLPKCFVIKFGGSKEDCKKKRYGAFCKLCWRYRKITSGGCFGYICDDCEEAFLDDAYYKSHLKESSHVKNSIVNLVRREIAKKSGVS